MYSIYFIQEFLSGKTFEEISNKKISDDEVSEYRYIFYRPNTDEDIKNGTDNSIMSFLKKFGKEEEEEKSTLLEGGSKKNSIY